MNKIVIAGGSGYIGRCLAKHFVTNGFEVVILTRRFQKPERNILYEWWDGETLGDWVSHIENATALINLSGKSVNCRYNEKNMQAIFDSRTRSTEVLGLAINNLQNPPEVWINAASATIYRHAEDHPQDEETGELGTGFSVAVCKLWEQTFAAQITPKTRKVALRMAIVLGKSGGVMPRFLNLVKFGLGGKQGSGKQYFSWIHEDDLAAMTDLIIANRQFQGVFNAAAPQPVPNHVFMRSLRKQAGAPFGFPTYKRVLKIGAWLIGTETELLLKSRWVVPKRITDAGYKFKYDTIAKAIAACI